MKKKGGGEGGGGKGKRCLGMERKRRRCETFAGESRFGLALVLTRWHQQDMRQHPLSSSFIIHAMSARYEVTVGLPHCFKM